MSTYKINLKDHTATSINGITFKPTETKPGEYEGLCLNPSQIPPDDLDDQTLDRMVKEAGMFYKMELGRMKGWCRQGQFDIIIWVSYIAPNADLSNSLQGV